MRPQGLRWEFFTPAVSAKTTPADAQSDRCLQLLELLAKVPDPRNPRGVRYRLAAVLAVAVSSGARSFTAIGEWAAELSGQQLARPGLAAVPDKSTLRKLFARLDANALDRVLGAWWWTRTKVLSGQQIIAIDGKAVRGPRTPRGRCRTWSRRWTITRKPCWGNWRWPPKATRFLASVGTAPCSPDS
ncbi:transposase family protein [Kocuria marina]|uniref:transposase family protein n=1 Tax=Kocuria marina TaxID=223184 RepID=UPI003F58F933